MKVTARYGGTLLCVWLLCGWLPAGPNASGDMATFESVAQSDYTGNLPYFTVSSDKLFPTVGALAIALLEAAE